MGATNVAVIEGEGVTAARGFPSETGLCESALATLFGEVKVDVVETLTVQMKMRSVHSIELYKIWCDEEDWWS